MKPKINGLAIPSIDESTMGMKPPTTPRSSNVKDIEQLRGRNNAEKDKMVDVMDQLFESL
jgi:hypothetical protein